MNNDDDQQLTLFDFAVVHLPSGDNTICPLVPNKEAQYPLVCECGGDVVYGPDAGQHSYWCPKYRPN